MGWRTRFQLTADDKKTLREAAKTVADKSLDATARLAAATTDAIASLHETNRCATA